MTQADRIREFVLQNYIAPARNRGLPDVEIRAGDVHREMGLSNSMPAVCSALGSNKFEALTGARTVARTGPSNGSNARFRFHVADRRPPERLAPDIPRGLAAGSENASQTQALDFSNAVVLVSCVKSKRAGAAPARDLYTSALFTGARDIAEQGGARWYVLSSLYGLVEPSAVIAPYDYTLNTLGVEERRAWAGRVFNQLITAEPNLRRVVMFAGFRYREFLTPKLLARGIKVDVPMANLRQGEQLAWLGERS